MRPLFVCLFLLSAIIMSLITPSKSECCKVPIKCVNGSKTTYRCYDCTESTIYCGVGKCNILGCNCDGGCRQGDSTMSCWNISSGCKLRSYFSTEDDFFSAIDTDSDGKLSFSEAKAYINEFRPTNVNVEEELFKLDTNGDGFLQFNEIDGY